MTATQHGKIDFTVMYVPTTSSGVTWTGLRGRGGPADRDPRRPRGLGKLQESARRPPQCRRRRAVAAGRARGGGPPADRELLAEMRAEHAQLHPPLAAVDEAMRRSAGDLTPLVQELSAVLGQHMRHEENSALPLIQEVLTPRDWSAFRRAMARRQGPRGAAMYVPWVTEGLGDEERRKFLRMMGPPVPVINRLFWQARYDKRDLWGN